MDLNTQRAMRELFEEFERIDIFRNHFKRDFTDEYRAALLKTYQIQETEQLVAFIELMADQAYSLMESIIEKDQCYPEYRKEIELQVLDALVGKQITSAEHASEIMQLKYTLNCILLKYYPVIYELSSFGYRLLDRNVQHFIYQFTTAIRHELEHRQ
ncbi:hypothetical protein [Mangrovibacterium sp.]|uniref:hypothetical protein n=1 Tax=Mangrovibacterium sp. TaxID=1961364 RepID=UPI0035624079